MSPSDPLNFRPSVGDRVGIMFFMVLGFALVVWSGISSAMYITRVVRGQEIWATVGFVNTVVDVPVGEAQTMVPMNIDTANIAVDQLTGAAFGTAIVSSLLHFAVIAALVTCLFLLATNSLRGRIFSRGNTRLVIGAGMAALVGFGLTSVLDRMVGNEVLLSLGGGSLENVAVMTADPMPFVLIAFAFGIIATAYTVGARMQRETEGLV